MGECISLPPVLPHAPAVAARAAQDFTPVDLWCVDNTMGTFIATTSEGLVELQGRDLRSPLGLTPAALLAQGAAVQTASVVSAPPRSSSASKLGDDRGEPVPSQVTPKLQLTSTPRKLYDQFQAARRQKRNEGVRRTLTPMVVDFRRIWSDGGAFTEGEGLTAWRPVAPPGYAALGDCIMKGFNPPASALVVLDTGVGGEGLGQAKGMPLVKAPRGYDLIWHDGNPKEEMRACFWRPIPHPGYVAMGCVATIGTSPPRKGIKCLHADAAVRAPAPRTPIWSVSKADKLLPPLSLWTVDEALSTFSVEPSDRLLPPEDRWRIKLPEPEELTPAYSLPQHDAQGVNVVVKTGSMSVLLFDALKIPLLEVETSGVEAGIRGPSRQVTQAYLGLRPGVFAYNRSLRHWEPVVEPVDIIAKCDANLGSKVR